MFLQEPVIILDLEVVLAGIFFFYYCILFFISGDFEEYNG